MKCNLCKKEINTKKERYVHVEDYDKEIFIKDLWMHLNCFNKAMNRDLNNLEKQAKEMLEKASQIFDSNKFNEIFPKKEKEYVIA